MALDFSKLVVEPLGRRHDRQAFSCDAPALNDYLWKQAGQDVKRDLASSWVLCAPGESQIVGYYTLTATAVDVSHLPPSLAKHAGRYNVVGAALLGRLAVDARYAHRGVGSHLLLNALRRVLRATETALAVKAVVVDALDEGAATFYEKFGFERLDVAGEPGNQPRRRLVLSLKTIREIFPGEGTQSDETSPPAW